MSINGNFLSVETPLDGNDTFALLNGNIPTRLSELSNDEGFIKDEPNAFAFINLRDQPTGVSYLINDMDYVSAWNMPTLVSSFTNDAGYITSCNIPTRLSGFSNDLGYLTHASLGLCNVAYTGNYMSLTGRPTLTALAATADYNDILLNKPLLSLVAGSGDYRDLTGNPTHLTDFLNDGTPPFATTNDLLGSVSATNTCVKINQPNYLNCNVSQNEYCTFYLSGGSMAGTDLLERQNPSYNLPRPYGLFTAGQPNMSLNIVNNSFSYLPNTGINAVNIFGQLELCTLPNFLKPIISYDVVNSITLTDPHDLFTSTNPLSIEPNVCHMLGDPITGSAATDAEVMAHFGISSMDYIFKYDYYQRDLIANSSSNMRFSLAGFKNFQADNITCTNLTTNRMDFYSDARIKKNIVKISSNSGLTAIAGLQPVGYRLIKDGSKHVGFIAQDLKAHIPGAVSTLSGTLPNGQEVEDMHTINYNAITTHTVGAIQALLAEVEKIKARLEVIESHVF